MPSAWQLSQFSASQAAIPLSQQALIREFRHCADINTNLYVVDARAPSVEEFGFYIDVGNFDLRTVSRPHDTLGSHPDRAYSERDANGSFFLSL